MPSLDNGLKAFYLDGKAVRRASLDGKVFFEKHNYNMEVDCDKPILSFKDGDVANITATVTDYDEPMPGETVEFSYPLETIIVSGRHDDLGDCFDADLSNFTDWIYIGEGKNCLFI